MIVNEDLATRAAAAGSLDRDGLLQLVADQAAAVGQLKLLYETALRGNDWYEDMCDRLETAGYEHFTALGRPWPKHAVQFGDFADMLPLELARLRFMTAPFQVDSGDVQHSWIQTALGGEFYPLLPMPEDVRIVDIAAALSKICRFTGQLRQFYSVAEHSVRVARLCVPELQFRALLHDGAEAYIADLASPVKHAPAMLAYRRAEQWLQKVIYLRFGIAGDDPPELKQADKVLLATEARDLLVPHQSGWHKKYAAPLAERIDPWPPEVAERVFLETFHQLKPERVRP